MRKAIVFGLGLVVASVGCTAPVSHGSADVALQAGEVAIRGGAPIGAGGIGGSGGVAPAGSGDDGGVGGGGTGSDGGADSDGSDNGGSCGGMASPYWVTQLVGWQAADDMLRGLGAQNAIDLANALDATLSVDSTGVYVGISEGILTLNQNDVNLELLINPDEVTPATLAGVEAAFAPAEEFQPPVSEKQGVAPPCTLNQFGISSTAPYVAYVYDPCSTCRQ